jgi:hypothetical protein
MTNSFVEIDNAINPYLMGAIQQFCEAITETRAPNQVIARDGDVYIKRWMLARKGAVPVYDDPTKQLGVNLIPSELENLYLHQFCRNDREDPHCHPWPNGSLVVRGWYEEEVFDDTGTFLYIRRRKAGDVILRAANSIHAITEVSSDCMSLFGTLQKSKSWGFWQDGKFIPWHLYHANSVLPESVANARQSI